MSRSFRRDRKNPGFNNDGRRSPKGNKFRLCTGFDGNYYMRDSLAFLRGVQPGNLRVIYGTARELTQA
jgi:hypothetical protein